MIKILISFFFLLTLNLQAKDLVKLSLDWVPQGEHGGWAGRLRA